MHRSGKFFKKQSIKLITIAIISLGLSACIGTVVGAVVDTTIAVVKIPFKVAGAIIDVATPGDESSELQLTDNQKPKDFGSSETEN